MLDLVTIFTSGGAVLWQRQLSPISAAKHPVNALIRDVLLEQRMDNGAKGYTSPESGYTLKWAFDNKRNLVFVAAYLVVVTKLNFVDELLHAMRTKFAPRFDAVQQGHASTGGARHALPDLFKPFDKHFDAALKACEMKAFGNLAGSRRKPIKQGGFKGKKNKHDSGTTAIPSSPTKALVDDQTGAMAAATAATAASGEATATNSTSVPSAVQPAAAALASKATTTAAATEKPPPLAAEKEVARLLKLRAMGKGSRRGGAPRPFQRKAKQVSPKKNTAGADGKKPNKKVMAKWGDEKLSAEEAASLDYSADIDDTARDQAYAAAAVANFGKPPEEGDTDYLTQYGEGEFDLDESDDDEKETKAGDDTKKKGGFMSFFKSNFQTLTGQKVLTAEDLQPVLEKFQEVLMKKNVAQEVADQLCKSVSASLVGKKQASFTSMRTTVLGALSSALETLLTPLRERDVLHEISLAKSEGRPYSIVFVGVNGVGKSTSLAKICCFLKNASFTVSLVACDTFRSGAIEQLRTHATALDVALYERGYQKDPAGIAMEGIKEAKKRHHDVVLIDTAGRMQDNQPLMEALSKLIVTNKPDLVLFVGEALVGNDAVDQLTKFNEALKRLSKEMNPRSIDGIVLTKFDTIDDKVGAAISMTYSTGKPIMFVGNGQTYRDLKKMNAKWLIGKLLN